MAINSSKPWKNGTTLSYSLFFWLFGENCIILCLLFSGGKKKKMLLNRLMFQVSTCPVKEYYLRGPIHSPTPTTTPLLRVIIKTAIFFRRDVITLQIFNIPGYA